MTLPTTSDVMYKNVADTPYDISMSDISLSDFNTLTEEKLEKVTSSGMISTKETFVRDETLDGLYSKVTAFYNNILSSSFPMTIFTFDNSKYFKVVDEALVDITSECSFGENTVTYSERVYNLHEYNVYFNKAKLAEYGII